jgi:hypothetical protein
MLKNDYPPNSCRMEMENTVKVFQLSLCRIWNEQPEQTLIKESTAYSPQK